MLWTCQSAPLRGSSSGNRPACKVRSGLHIRLENSCARGIFQTPQLRPHGNVSHMAVDKIAAFLNLCNNPIFAQNGTVQVIVQRDNGIAFVAVVTTSSRHVDGLSTPNRNRTVNFSDQTLLPAGALPLPRCHSLHRQAPLPKWGTITAISSA